MLKEKIMKMVFNHKMERYARMLKLEISRDDKSILLEVLPNGESNPIQITIGHYEILTGEKNGIRISHIRTSRQWMTELIQTLAPEHFIAFENVKLLKLIL